MAIKDKIGIYIRLSNADGDGKDESNSILGQRAYIHNFLDDNKDFINCRREEFIDDGYSGTTEKRPQFQYMIEKAYKGELKTIIVRDLSRFFRDYIKSGNYLECVFPFLGVRFISINDNYDSNNYKGTTGGMEIVMRNIVYTAYSKDLSNKVRTAKTMLMKQGKYMGNTPPYGYVKYTEEKHKLSIDKNVRHVVELIFKYANDGYKVNEIVEQLNKKNIETPIEYFKKLYPNNKSFQTVTKAENIVWQYDTVSRILKNKVYMGCVVSGNYRKEQLNSKKKKAEPIVVEDMHEGIVSKEEFINAQSVFNKVKNVVKVKSDTYPLKSIMQCGHCNRTLARKKRRTVSNIYTCLYCRKAEEEKIYNVRENVVEEMVFNEIQSYMNQLKENRIKYKNENEENADTISKYEKNIDNLKAEKKDLYKKYMLNELSRDEYLKYGNLIELEIADVNSAIEYTQSKTRDNMKNLEKIEEVNELTPEIVQKYVKSVVVYDENNIEIRLKSQ